jgi:hypothetical protein
MKNGSARSKANGAIGIFPVDLRGDVEILLQPFKRIQAHENSQKEKIYLKPYFRKNCAALEIRP